MLIGLPGSGKTTLARWLSRNSALTVVSRDTIRAAMFPVCTYTLEEKAAAYAAMKSAIGINLALGRSICTDGITFANQADRMDMAELAREAGAQLFPACCDCPIDVAQRRIADDTETVFPDRNSAAVIEVASRMSPAPPEAYHLDMIKPTEIIGVELLNHLGMDLVYR
jgi:predicted kinase